jgi:hypothetical protein
MPSVVSAPPCIDVVDLVNTMLKHPMRNVPIVEGESGDGRSD